MNYLVIYDISENSKRTKLADKLKDYGLIRIQKSVFIGELTEKDAKEAEKHLKDVSGYDAIHFITLCEKCYKKIKMLGDAWLPKEHENVVI